MSGGRLVVLDRLGREVKRYPLLSGLATLGSDPRCDIRVMLPAVSGHHATVVVHTNQTVVRNVGSGETLVNGAPVSVAALRHGDLLTVGDRDLRWEYADPTGKTSPATHLTLCVSRRSPARARRAGSAAAAAAARSPALRLALELQHRASMPGNASGKQVAVVQPQRRDTAEQNGAPEARRGGARGAGATKAELWVQSRKSGARHTPPNPVSHSRPSSGSGRRAPALRTLLLRRAALQPRVTKIQAPTAIDHTKQAALMLMAGHTPKSKLPSPKLSSGKKTPSYVIKKPSPVRKTPRGSRGSNTPASARQSAGTRQSVVARQSAVSRRSVTPKQSAGKSSVSHRASLRPKSPGSAGTRSSKRGSGSQSASLVELTSPHAGQRSPRRRSVSQPPPPRKSALRDPTAERKRDSIKFDLSNLHHYDQENDPSVVTLGDTTKGTYNNSVSENELTLRYSDTSSVQSPSPRRSIHSRSGRMLEKSLGTSLDSPRHRPARTSLAATPDSPRRKSNRGTLIIQKALEADDSAYSRRTTKTLTDHSSNTTVASAFRTRTLSPRSPNQNVETYSIVDLVSIDSNESGRSASVYDSAGSTRSSSIVFGTPQNSVGRKMRSTIDPSMLVGSSTPYVGKTRNSSVKSQKSSKESINESVKSTRSTRGARRSKSLTTPENTGSHVLVNSTRISRASKSRSRINDSDLLLISLSDSQLEDESPRSSRRISRSAHSNPTSPAGNAKSSPAGPAGHRSTRSNAASPPESNQTSPIISRTTKSKGSSPVERKSRSNQASPAYRSPVQKRKSSRRSGGDGNPSSSEGVSTPESRRSPQEVGTPVLSIQSLLDSSQSSAASPASKKGRASVNIKRKTIGVLRSEPRRRAGAKSKSLNFTARKGLLRLSKESSVTSDKTDDGAPKTSNEKMVTPKSAVKLVQEAVKNKHSTAKKPQSKRSIIDNLDESDIVKQLFNSPVKRKLSQSMTEFSRKQLFDDDEAPRRPTRNTIAVANRTPDNSILDHTEAFTPDRFVSPISTPGNSPNLTGIKRLFRKNTPDNDLRNVRGVKAVLRTPRARRSVKNDLTKVSGVKQVFARSPKNRLSDVRVKEVFAAAPKNDLRRVSGVKSLFQSQKKQKSPKNDLSDVRGVRNLFRQKSPGNDLRRVSGVKRALQRNSPRNDLSDVRGVKRMFRQEKDRNNLNDVSGVEELFNESSNSARDAESLFDRLIGKPPIKAVYSKSFVKKPAKKPKTRSAKSLHTSLDVITSNVEEWLEKELQKRLHKEDDKVPRANMTRELQKLTTDTVEGAEPIRTSRARSSTAARGDGERKSAAEAYGAHALPLKKRSLAEAAPDAGARSSSLPLKKRAVLHSTPVKGRSRRALMAPDLGRVSPIALTDTSLRSEPSTLPMSESKPTKGKRATKISIEAERLAPPTPKSPKAGRSLNKSKPSPRKSKSPPKATDVSLRNKRSPQVAKASPRLSKPSPRTSKVSPVTKASLRKSKPSPKVTEPSPRASKVSPRLSKPSPKVNQVSPRVSKPSPKASKVSPRPSIVSPRASKVSSRVSKPSPRANKPSPKKTKPSSKKTEKSPKKTEALPQNITPQSKEESPKRSTRARGAKADTSRTNAKKGRTSLVISKKSPVMSPKPPARTRRGKTEDTSTKVVPIDLPKVTPKKARATRKQEEKPATPKRNTRAKVTKATVVVGKPSPQLKPQGKTRAKVDKEAAVEEAPKTRAKKDSKVVPEAPKKTRKTAASEKTIEEVESKSKRRKVESVKESPKRTRRTVVVENEPKGKKNRADESKSRDVTKSPEKKRGRRTQEESVKVEPKRNTRKTQAKEEPKPSKTKAGAAKVEKASRDEAKEPPKATRSRKPVEAQSSSQSPPARARVPRKRKSSPGAPPPAKVSKLRETKVNMGRNTTIETTESSSAGARQKRSVVKEQVSVRESEASAGRGTRRCVHVAAARKETAKETVPKTNSRKKKTEAETSPVKTAASKVTRKKSPAAARTRKASPGKASPAKATRAARGKAEPAVVATKTSGRSRRR